MKIVRWRCRVAVVLESSFIPEGIKSIRSHCGARADSEEQIGKGDGGTESGWKKEEQIRSCQLPLYSGIFPDVILEVKVLHPQ